MRGGGRPELPDHHGVCLLTRQGDSLRGRHGAGAKDEVILHFYHAFFFCEFLLREGRWCNKFDKLSKTSTVLSSFRAKMYIRYGECGIFR